MLRRQSGGQDEAGNWKWNPGIRKTVTDQDVVVRIVPDVNAATSRRSLRNDLGIPCLGRKLPCEKATEKLPEIGMSYSSN
jgi:hypothetical protein